VIRPRVGCDALFIGVVILNIEPSRRANARAEGSADLCYISESPRLFGYW